MTVYARLSFDDALLISAVVKLRDELGDELTARLLKKRARREMSKQTFQRRLWQRVEALGLEDEVRARVRVVTDEEMAAAPESQKV